VEPLVVIAEFACSEQGDAELRQHLDRTLEEVRSDPGCLQATLWSRADRRYQFFTVFRDAEALRRWVDHPFHREVLMPGFRRWCTTGWFGELRFEQDHRRARKCPACGRWSQSDPGYDERLPERCARCEAPLEPPDSGARTRSG
jgi:quinol monooxygenase YgiN